MSFDPLAPYGPLVESTVRVVTWNVWGRYGADWEGRQAALEDALAEVRPDVICLAESWQHSEESQPQRVAARLNLPYYHFVGDWQQDEWISGIGLVSRWPMSEPSQRPLRCDDGSGLGQAVHVAITAERGAIQLFAVILDYPLHASATRQSQVKQLVSFVEEVASKRDPILLCGDFNAAPDSDEIRMLTGRSAAVSPGAVFYDSWELAGDGSAGYTWSNRNPLAAVSLYPDRRFDYILSAWPRRGGVGHPVRCALLGVRAPDDLQISDHYGLVADLRY